MADERAFAGRFDGKKVAVFSANYLPHLGGIENYTYHVASEMSALGAQVTVATLACEGAPEGWERDPAGFDVLRSPSRGFLGGRFPVAKPWSASSQALEGRQFDYVVVNARFYPQSLAGAAFAENRGIRPVVIDHGSAHLTLGNAVLDAGVEFVEHAMTAALKRHPADYYGVSKRSSEWLSHFGIASCGELYNSIDAAAYAASASSRDFRAEQGLAADAPVVAFVGRITPEKGVAALVETARNVPEATFLAAGDGALLKTLAPSAPANFVFLGRLSAEDTAALLTQADLFCLPTRSEGFATSLLEAAACGTPSVITDVGGARELIADEHCGRIVDSADAPVLARAIRQELSDRSALQEKGRLARKRVEGMFSWKKTALAVLEACERANSPSVRK